MASATLCATHVVLLAWQPQTTRHPLRSAIHHVSTHGVMRQRPSLFMVDNTTTTTDYFAAPVRPTPINDLRSIRETSPIDGLRFSVRETCDVAAAYAGVTPKWFDAFFGCILFTLLAAFGKEVGAFADAPAVGAAAGRLLAIALFTAVQSLAFLPPERWLRLDAAEPADRNPLFQVPPGAGVTWAFIFAVPIATLAQLCGIAWLPAPEPFPDSDAAFFKLVAMPFTDEIFFRAWLLTAIREAGGSQAAALIASTVLFGLYKVPLATALAPEGSSVLLLYQALGAFLSFLYQRSGGSLPLVVITSSTCNLIVLSLRAAQVDSVLPF
jgi:membrane protease YdiL (CAAX protease family)